MREMKTVTLNGKKYDSFADAKVREAVGDLNGLETTAKSNLVEAINEATKKGGGGVYVGSGDMPEGYNVQINPSGTADTAATQEWVAAQIQAAINATWEASY